MAFGGLTDWFKEKLGGGQQQTQQTRVPYNNGFYAGAYQPARQPMSQDNQITNQMVAQGRLPASQAETFAQPFSPTRIPYDNGFYAGPHQQSISPTRIPYSNGFYAGQFQQPAPSTDTFEQFRGF